MTSYFNGLKLHHCDYCMKKYFILDLLTEHMIEAHKINPDDLKLRDASMNGNPNDSSPFKSANDDYMDSQINDTSKNDPFAGIVDFKPSIKKQIEGVNTSFTCYICGKTFIKEVALKIHIASKHNRKNSKTTIGRKTKRIFQCNSCPMKFDSEMQLKSHVKLSHSRNELFSNFGINKYKCSQCSKVLTSEKYLEMHMLTHKKMEIYRCDKCAYIAQNKYDLQSHFKKDHLGFSIHTCSVCDKNFTQKSSLYRHQMLHTGEKPFVCDACPYRSNNKSNLRGHMKTHTGQKPFSCPFCYQPFTIREKRDAHITQEHSAPAKISQHL